MPGLPGRPVGRLVFRDGSILQPWVWPYPHTPVKYSASGQSTILSIHGLNSDWKKRTPGQGMTADERELLCRGFFSVDQVWHLKKSMTKRFSRLAVLPLALCSLSLWAAAPIVDPVTLVPSSDQRAATKVITRIMERHHYKKVPVDDELSFVVFDRYLERLDPNRSVFLASDVEALSVYRHRLDDALRQARLEPAFAIFKVFRARMDERAEYAVSLLTKDFDFQRDEAYVFDRTDAPWAADHAALDEIWRKRVKNDVLTLRLAGKTQEEVVKTLRKRYERTARSVKQLNAEDVFQIFVNTYMTSVEPHTAYLSPRTSENFRIRMSLSLEGIGAVLQTDNEHTVVRSLIAGGPAAKSGQLQVDDRITGVGQGHEDDMVDVVSWRLEDVVELIRGPKDSVVRLEILPKGIAEDGARKEVTLVRNRIELEEQAAKKHVLEVKAGDVEARIGVIEVPTFYRDVSARARGEEDYRSTSRDVRRLLGELTNEGVDGVIVDLRGDGGGSLSEAIEVTGLFIESGPVVQVKDSQGRIEVYEDPDPDIAYKGPLAVLVDRHSASASEIFAGAIQDYGRGVIIGEPTFGKGTVQSLMDVSRFVRGNSDDLGQLKLTIAQFFRVSGASTQHRGVVPDIVFPTAFDSGEHGERSLENALPWASARPASFSAHDLYPEDAVSQVRSRHEERTSATPVFNILLEQAQAEQAVRDLEQATLLESRRKAERTQRENAQTQRENAFRAARGLPLLAEDKKQEQDADEDEVSEVWLEETAQILADLIATAFGDQPLLRTARQQL